MKKEVKRGPSIGACQEVVPRRKVCLPMTYDEQRSACRDLVNSDFTAAIPAEVRHGVHAINRMVCPPKLSSNRKIRHFQEAAVFGLIEPTSPWRGLLIRALQTGIAQEVVKFLRSFAAHLREDDPYGDDEIVVKWWEDVIILCQKIAEHVN